MMKYLFFLLLTPLLSYAGGNEIPDYMQVHKPFLSMACIDEKTQHTMDQCGERSLASATSRMNALLDLLKKNNISAEPDLFKFLKSSQLAWKTYMESSCKVETYDSRHGSGFHSILNACHEAKINERISFLSWMMDNP